MIVDKYGRVAGSIDLATLAQMYAQTDDDDLRAHYRQVAAENGFQVGESVVSAVETEVEEREDGVHNVGGGWYEIVVDGEMIDKVRGAEAAQEAYEAYQEANNGDDDVS
jgi:hypothetical protein